MKPNPKLDKILKRIFKEYGKTLEMLANHKGQS